MKRIDNNTDDSSSNGGCLSTIDRCRKAVAYCNERATQALFDSDRDHWFQLAGRNEHRAVVIARGER